MDRLLSLEPSNQVSIRIEPGQKCYGELTLRNVMYTMPVAFRLQPVNRVRYTVRPQSGIIAPLATLTVEIAYLLPPTSPVPDSVPHSDDSFLLHSVVVPGAAIKDPSSTFDSVPSDWFTTKKKQVFIDSGIRIFFVGSAVLARLVAAGSMDSVREVLERSEPEWRAADSVDSAGQSLLHLAIARGRPDLVQLLLEFDPNVEARSRAGSTPLEAAAAAGEALIVELLLARRASTERSPASALGPLHLAAAAGHTEVLQLLLLKGAVVDSPAADGQTALHLAAEERRRDCARMLLAAGARAEACGGADRDTPLHVAAAGGDEHMVKLLLERGGAGLRELRNAAGRTAYDTAAEGVHARLFDVLRLEEGLAAAARKGEARGVQRMIERGAAVKGRDQHGWTALMRAAFKGKVEVMKALMDKGAEVNARDEEGYAALHCAAEAGQAEAVEALVKRGADLEARTVKGATAMQIALSLGYAGIARILAQGGAVAMTGVATGGGGMRRAAEKLGMRKVGNGGGGLKEPETQKKASRMTGGRLSRRGLQRAALPVA
ncbi:ankyrin repeat domain-containing protein 65 [Cocos nucifera]|nr:ankyrin repeat domain-containing protein 65 [Cocos nucifera]